MKPPIGRLSGIRPAATSNSFLWSHLQTWPDAVRCGIDTGAARFAGAPAVVKAVRLLRGAHVGNASNQRVVSGIDVRAVVA
jgi:hypothetical protein